MQQLTSSRFWHWYYCTVLVISSLHLDLGLTHPICQAKDQTNAYSTNASLWTGSKHSLNLKSSNAGTLLGWKSSPMRSEAHLCSLKKKIKINAQNKIKQPALSHAPCSVPEKDSCPIGSPTNFLFWRVWILRSVVSNHVWKIFFSFDC